MLAVIPAYLVFLQEVPFGIHPVCTMKLWNNTAGFLKRYPYNIVEYVCKMYGNTFLAFWNTYFKNFMALSKFNVGVNEKIRNDAIY